MSASNAAPSPRCSRSIEKCDKCAGYRHCYVGKNGTSAPAAAGATPEEESAASFHVACKCHLDSCAFDEKVLAVTKKLMKNRCCSWSLMQPNPKVRRSFRLLGKEKCAFCGNSALTCTWKCCPSTSNCSGLKDMTAILDYLYKVGKLLNV